MAANKLPRVREAIKGTHKGRWQRRADQKKECRVARRHIAKRVRETKEDPFE